ncbi:hypothetical protein SEVIR_8G112533v4 [Setaria viridis]
MHQNLFSVVIGCPTIILVVVHQNLTNVSLFILQSIKPTVLIGTSGVGMTSTKYVVETMASFNEVIFVSFCYLGCNVEVLSCNCGLLTYYISEI